MDIKNYIASVKDFPKQGIIFRDVTPILENPEVFKEATKQIVGFCKEVKANKVLGPEARGFWFGIPVAYECDLPFEVVRKPGKLPRKTISSAYSLEYGTDELCMHEDAVKPGDKVLIVDDLLATGGTVAAMIKMVKAQGAEVVGAAFVVELDELNGKEKFEGVPTFALTHFEGE